LHPADICRKTLRAGAAIGIFVPPIIARPIATKLMPLVWAAEAKKKAVFYATFFLLSYQFGTMFDDVRPVGNALKKMFDQEEQRAQITGMGSTNPGMPLVDRLSNSGVTQNDTAAYHPGKEQARR
jgi:hypothetical protein